MHRPQRRTDGNQRNGTRSPEDFGPYKVYENTEKAKEYNLRRKSWILEFCLKLLRSLWGLGWLRTEDNMVGRTTAVTESIVTPICGGISEASPVSSLCPFHMAVLSVSEGVPVPILTPWSSCATPSFTQDPCIPTLSNTELKPTVTGG
jgi:hypothetical protein